MPTTPNRGYDLIPTGVAPDVPYWFNRLLSALDTDVNNIEDNWVNDPAFTTKANAKISELLAAGGTMSDGGQAKAAATTTGTADDLVVTKWYSVWTGPDALALGLPVNMGGVLEVLKYGTTAVVLQRYTTPTLDQTIYHRAKLSGGWTPWRQTGGNAYKRVPVALTSGNGSGVDTATSRTVRYPVKLARPVPRWRVHIRNINPRYGNPITGALSFTGLGIAPATAVTAPDGKLGTLKTLSGAFTTAADGSEWASAWIEDYPLAAHTDYILTGGYTCAAQSNFAGASGGWVTASATDWNVAAPAALALSQAVPLDVWLELEVPAATPVAAYFGDSLTAGVAARLPIYDSWAHRHALDNGYLPTLYAHSGMNMAGFTSSAAYVYHRFDSANPAKPDRLYWAMGYNDVFGGASVASLRSTFAAVHPVMAAQVSRNIHLVTILPAKVATAPEEAVRKAWNEVLRTELPGDAVACWDPAAALTDPDGSTLDRRWAATTTEIHLSAAGYARWAASMTAAAATPRPYTVETTAGRTVKIWDYVNGRDQLIYGDTGWRDITTSAPVGVTLGTCRIRRVGNTVFLNVQLIATDTAGNISFVTMPPGFAADPICLRAGTASDRAGTSVRQISPYLGDLRILDMQVGKNYEAGISFTTNDPWPSTLPGTASGSLA